ncbi:MAG: hypothetical protein BM564_04580 [Bacteroidetes bacterium MedPE-SWsnd-G2]|nr:MAG: hypothetical protein BM564_04580 [Bacteroidetes bacterium MedPE-SWsnd-G2]
MVAVFSRFYSPEEFPFLIYLTWVTSFVLFVSFVVLSTYLIKLRKALRRKEKERKDCKLSYEPFIIEYLYSSEDPKVLTERQHEIIETLKPKIQSASQRKVIISILYNLMNEVSGEMAESIKLFYYKTGLIEYGVAKLQNKNWYVIAKGIGELTRFNIKEVHQQVEPFVNHERKEVRSEAHMYMVNLFHFEGLTFLDNLDVPLSEWNQIQLLEVLQKIDNQSICDIKPWLNSKNDTVVIFALKLAEIYNQYEVNTTLLGLLNHPNKNIRIAVIDALTHLYGIEAVEKLKANFNNLSVEEQISFFQMLEKLVMPTDEPFVEAHLFHKNFDIQLLALKILKSINIDKYFEFSGLPAHKKSQAMLKLTPTN